MRGVKPGFGDRARDFAHLLGAPPAVDQRARNHVARLRAPVVPASRTAAIRAPPSRRHSCRAASSDSSISASSPLTTTLRHIFAAEAAPNCSENTLRAGETELRRQRQELAACGPPSSIGEAARSRRDRRHDRGFDVAAAGGVDPAAAACFAAGDVELRSKKYALRFRCGATERAAAPILPCRDGADHEVGVGDCAARDRRGAQSSRRGRAARRAVADSGEHEVPSRDAMTPHARADRRPAPARLRRNPANRYAQVTCDSRLRPARTHRRA